MNDEGRGSLIEVFWTTCTWVCSFKIFMHTFKVYYKITLLLLSFEKFMSSRPEVFCKKGVLKKSAKFTGKHLWHGLSFYKEHPRHYHAANDKVNISQSTMIKYPNSFWRIPWLENYFWYTIALNPWFFLLKKHSTSVMTVSIVSLESSYQIWLDNSWIITKTFHPFLVLI